MGHILFLARRNDSSSSHRFLHRLFLRVFLFCIPFSTLARGIILAAVPHNLTAIWGEHTDTFSVIGMLFLVYCFIVSHQKKQAFFLVAFTCFMVLASNATDLVALAIDKPKNTILSTADSSITYEDRVLFLNGNDVTLASSYDHDLIHYNSYPARSIVAMGGVDVGLPTDEDRGIYLLNYMRSNGLTLLYYGDGNYTLNQQLSSAFDSASVMDFGLYRLIEVSDGSPKLVLIQQDLPNTISWRLRRNRRFHTPSPLEATPSGDIDPHATQYANLEVLYVHNDIHKWSGPVKHSIGVTP